MASTKNKNTQQDYNLEKWSLDKQTSYCTYAPYGVPRTSMFAGDGLIHGRMGSETLSHNSSDIESFLFGIGSTNLVNPNKEPVPQFKPLNTLSIIDKQQVILPEPLAVKDNQRQYPMK